MNTHSIDELDKVSRQLCLRLKQSGVETVPAEVHWALLQQAGGCSQDAINNGQLYLDCKRPVSELLLELSVGDQSPSNNETGLVTRVLIVVALVVIGLILFLTNGDVR